MSVVENAENSLQASTSLKPKEKEKTFKREHYPFNGAQVLTGRWFFQTFFPCFDNQ